MMKDPDFLNQWYEFIPVIGNNPEMFHDVVRHLKLKMSEQVMLALAIYKVYVSQNHTP